ncbi:MAG: hydrogenase maturation protease [Deltaproteobacteria bacterium]|jgi:hydrogenase maturation protease|nr:hydrogenase maturation protease [Deltaproteobacteria bacterium]
MTKKPTAIIGVGNYLMSDEGVGIHAIAKLRTMNWSDDIDIIDGGTPGVALLHMIEGRKLVVIIDCADFEAKPGEISIFNAADLKRDTNDEISLHATDLLGALELAKHAGSYPEKVIIVGIQPEHIGMGTSLSTSVEESLNEIPKTLKDIIL